MPACMPAWANAAMTTRNGARRSGALVMRSHSCDKTVRGMINFLGCHEAYHVGQLGFLRQWVTRG